MCWNVGQISAVEGLFEVGVDLANGLIIEPVSPVKHFERDLSFSSTSQFLNDKVHDVSFESALRAAGFEVQVVKNQGAGAAMQRIEAARRLFPSMWFNKETTEAGLDAIGWYHEKRDEMRGIGLGPNHDWASHGADAFGLVAVAYEMPQGKSKETAFKRRKVV